MTATFACSLVVCFCTCTNTHVQKETPACRRAARSMVTRSLLLIVRLLCSPETCTNNNNRSMRVQNNHASHSYTSTAVAPVIGTQAKLFFSTKVFVLARAPDGGVRVGTYACVSQYTLGAGAQYKRYKLRAYHNTHYVPVHN